MAAVFETVPEFGFRVAKAWQKVGGVSRIMMVRSDPTGCFTGPARTVFFRLSAGWLNTSTGCQKKVDDYIESILKINAVWRVETNRMNRLKTGCKWLGHKHKPAYSFRGAAGTSTLAHLKY